MEACAKRYWPLVSVRFALLEKRAYIRRLVRVMRNRPGYFAQQLKKALKVGPVVECTQRISAQARYSSMRMSQVNRALMQHELRWQVRFHACSKSSVPAGRVKRGHASFYVH